MDGARQFEAEQLPLQRGRQLAPLVHATHRPAEQKPGERKLYRAGPKLWADFDTLIGIFSQRVGPSLAILTNPAQVQSSSVSSEFSQVQSAHFSQLQSLYSSARVQSV